MTAGIVSQYGVLTGLQTQASSRVTTFSTMLAYGPAATKQIDVSAFDALIARTGGTTNVSSVVTNLGTYIAYATSVPASPRQDTWTFILDGHRFYVLPLGPEGDWGYDTTTHEWSQFQTQGFDGLNFRHATMWGLRIMGGDQLYPVLLEMSANQPFDDGFRPIEHIVTGGVPTRSRNSIGVANFTVTASVGDDSTISYPISLAFSDDNGVSYSAEFPISLTNVGSELLIWNALGSFSAPGRVFRITDYGGPVRLDGADVVLTVGNGADSGIEQQNG